MLIPTGKIEKAASKDESRPVLTHVHLTTDADGARWLEATDSYKLVRVPAEQADDDVDGLIPAEAFATARKLRAGGRVTSSSSGEVRYSIKAGTDAVTRAGDGTFPKSAPLFPTSDPVVTFGLNPRILLDAAEALGAEVVAIEVREPARALVVRPSGSGAGEALVMPVRLG